MTPQALESAKVSSSLSSHSSTPPSASLTPFNLAPLSAPSFNRQTRFNEPCIRMGCSCCCTPAHAGEPDSSQLPAQPTPDLQHNQSMVLSVTADCAPFQVSTPHADPCFLSCDRSREAFVRCARGYQARKDRQGSLSCFVTASTWALSTTSCFAWSQLEQGAHQCRLDGRQSPKRVVGPGEALQLAPHATRAQCLHHLKHCRRAHSSAQPVTVHQLSHQSGHRRTGRTVLPSSLQDLRSKHVAPNYSK